MAGSYATKGTDLTFNSRTFGRLHVVKLSYRNDKTAIALNDDNGEEIAVLSVNIPEAAHLLGENEFFAKTWTENEGIAEDALASGIFQDTGRTSGQVLEARIWKFS